jgi:hypothetical protein
LFEVPVAIHVVGLLVEAWAMDVTGEQGLTLSVLANFMSSQVRTLVPTCENLQNHKFYDRYDSDTAKPIGTFAEFGIVESSPRAAAVAIILSNLTLPNQPPIPPVGLGMTLIIVWAELGLAFTVGISCIILAVYHIRLISKQDQAESDARANAYRQRQESSYRSDSDYFEAGDDSGMDDDASSTKEHEYDDEENYRRREDDTGTPARYDRQSSSSSNGGYGGGDSGGGGWSWPLSYIFGGQQESSRHSRSSTPRSSGLRNSQYMDSPRHQENSGHEHLLPSNDSGSESGQSMGETDFNP